MSLRKANLSESAIPFGIYGFDKGYLNHMSEKFDDVYKPEETLLYVGPLYSAIDETGKRVEIFVPMLPGRRPYLGKEAREILKSDGTYRNVVNLIKGIPAPDAKRMTAVRRDDLPDGFAFFEAFYKELVILTANTVEIAQRKHGNPIEM